MHYTSSSRSGAARSDLLARLGDAVRKRRGERGFTMRELAMRAAVSERFLAQVESGEGNISVLRLMDVANALDVAAADLLARAEPPLRDSSHDRHHAVALLGLRGAGKSAVGARVAKKLKAPFIELDAIVAESAGMSLATIFELHGETYYRKLERDALKKVLDAKPTCVIATGGSIVTDAETYALLKERATTVWLKARARDHWKRVVGQGDLRPMKNRSNAMSELESLLRARRPLYAQAAHIVDSSAGSLEDTVSRVLDAVNGSEARSETTERAKR